MEYSNYTRKPFKVDAIEITDDNIEEISHLIGELRENTVNGGFYIHVNKRLVPNVWKVYPGFFMTKMGDNVRCYTRKIFLDQFVLSDEHTNSWCDYINGVTPDESGS